MPPFRNSLVCSVLLGLILHLCALEVAKQAANNEPLPYCLLGPDQEGMSMFSLGDKEYLVCRRGHFFNFEIDPDSLNPFGCTTCQRHTHYMDSRNYCPQCKRCTTCRANEVETQPCTIYQNRKCKPRSSVPPNVTIGNQYDLTTLEATSTDGLPDETLTTTTCPPCASPTQTRDEPATTLKTETLAQSTDLENCNRNIGIVAGALGPVCIVLAVLVVYMCYKKYKQRKDQENPDQPPNARELQPLQSE